MRKTLSYRDNPQPLDIWSFKKNTNSERDYSKIITVKFGFNHFSDFLESLFYIFSFGLIKRMFYDSDCHVFI